jgi:hypothetical protein
MDNTSKLLREWPSGLEELGKSKQERQEIEKYGRIGMLQRDFDKFIPHPARKWSKRELKNRIAWLKKERGRLLGRPEKAADLEKTKQKLARYTRELFRRESARNQKKERDEHNAKRRRARAAAKKKRLKALTDAWIEKRMVNRKTLKS